MKTTQLPWLHDVVLGEPNLEFLVPPPVPVVPVPFVLVLACPGLSPPTARTALAQLVAAAHLLGSCRISTSMFPR